MGPNLSVKKEISCSGSFSYHCILRGPTEREIQLLQIQKKKFKKGNYLQNKQKVRCRQWFRHAELRRARDCVFSSRSPLPTCFCLRCWHSNTNYTWNITPTHKNSLLSYVRWDPRWCLLSFAFFPFTNLARTRSDIPGSLLHHCASSAFFRNWGCGGDAAACLVLSSNLSAPLIACDVCFVYVFRRCVSSATGSFHAVESQRGNH